MQLVYLWKNEKDEIWIVHHIVVSKTTLVCTAAYAHPECFILDQLVKKQATAMAEWATT